MIPYFVIDQINIGPVVLYTWGLMIGLGFSAGYLWLLYSVKKKGLVIEKFAGLALVIFLGGALGAKVLPVILLPGGFFDNIDLLFSQQSGAMFMGGLLGAMFFGWLYIKLAGLDFWQTMDLLVLPTALGIGIGRLGCFFINDHLGAVTSLPWGILWPDNVVRQPVALYESLAGFLLFGIFLWLVKKLKGKAGRPALFFLAAYGSARFLIDFTRQSQGALADPRWGIFSISQWLSLLILVFVVLLYISRLGGKQRF